MRRSIFLLAFLSALLVAALVPGVAGQVGSGPAKAVLGSKTPRPPIVITDDSMFTPANGVVRGSGTADDPYVISGWEIDGKVWAPQTPLPSSPFPPGIFIQGTDDHVVIKGNHILDNPRSQIMVTDASHVTIRDNLLQRTPEAPRRVPYDDGVTLVDVKDVTVAENTIKHAGAPLGVNGIIAVTEIRSGPYELEDVTIHDNTIRNSGDFDGRVHGIIVDAGRRITITENNIENVGEVAHHQAFELRNLTDLTVRDNTARDPDPARHSRGMKAAHLTDATFRGNVFRGQDLGAHVRDGTDLRYVQNTFQDHDEVALRLTNGLHPSLEGNTLSGSGIGLVLESTVAATATDNTLFGNGLGLSVLGDEVGHYDHTIGTSNTIEGRPVQYLVNASGPIDGDALDAGYLALVSAEDAFLNGTPPLPANGQGLLVAGGRNVNVDAGTLDGHGTTLKAVGTRGLTVGNLTGTDAVLRRTPNLRLHNSTIRDSEGHGIVVGPGSGGAVLENLTVESHDQGVGIVVNETDGLVGRDLVVEHNDRGIRVTEADSARFKGSSIAINTIYGLNATDRHGPQGTFVDARDNWWGDADGPANYGGDGNAVVSGPDATVSVLPVLSSPPGDAGDPDPG